MGTIGGLWSFGGGDPESALLRMAEALAHRGGRGRRFVRTGELGLYEEGASTCPESPKEEGELVFHGRIDNREELLRELALPPGASTHALIAKARARWGRECAERLRGELAFALWDARSESLFLARDRFGVRPLYYCWEPGAGGLFAFASEIKGLFAIREISRRPRESAVVDFVAGLVAEPSETAYERIARLPPGHWMEVSRSGLRIERYYSLPDGSGWEGDDRELEEELRRRLSRAVSRRLRPGAPTGIFLSGGIDSSAIAGLLSEQLSAERGPEAISAVHPTMPECDESTFLQAMVGDRGLRLHLVRGDLLDPLREIEQMLYRQDGLIVGYNLFLNTALYREAAAHGIRVLFDGFDGDTVVSHGSERLVELAKGGRWGTLAREAKLLASGESFSTWDVWKADVLRPILPLWARLARLKLRQARGEGLPRLPKRELARKHALAERMFAAQSLKLAAGRSVYQAHRLRLSLPVLAPVFESQDKEAAWWGMEAAHPFFDQEVVEWCLGLPSDQKLREGLGRYALRGAVRGIVPEVVRLRKGKSDLSPVLTRLLHRHNQEQLRGLLGEDRPLLEPYLEWAELETIWHRYQGAVNPEDCMTLWRAKVLALWLRGLESGKGWMERPPRAESGER